MLKALFLIIIITDYSIATVSTSDIGTILVNTAHIPCRDVKLYSERIVCEIRNEEDEMKIERFGLSGCYGSTLSCAEGDIKTCMPLMTINTLHYQCFCHLSHQGTPTVRDYYWTGWLKLSTHLAGFIYRRRLMNNSTNDYIAEEYNRDAPNLFIVSNYSLPDSVFSASSYYGNNDAYKYERARLDDYFDLACGWTANTANPWLKISLPASYEVINVLGIYIKQRCDALQYPTVIDVTTSVDDVLWQDVVKAEDIATRYSSYNMQGSVSVWFSRSYKTQYWKIYIVDYIWHPSMKCDLIGNIY